MSNARVCSIRAARLNHRDADDACAVSVDTLRRMFVKWLAAARKSKSRRMRLAEREDELRLEILAAAWEAWRDRFCENRLRDLARYALVTIKPPTSTI
jgi:hypothetical protein